MYVLRLLERTKKTYFSQNHLLMMLKDAARCLMLLDHRIGRRLIQVRHVQNVLSQMFNGILLSKILIFLY